jgi:transposase
MAPLVRRSWAPRGHTPILYQRTRSHQKVSAIAALCVTPQRDCVHMYFRLDADANINSTSVSYFLSNLSRHLRGPVVLLWDRFAPHRAKKARALIGKRDIHPFFFPPYAPELNPVENLWGYLKTNPMANLAPLDVLTLAKTTRHHGRSLQRKQYLLRSFVENTPLFSCLK